MASVIYNLGGVSKGKEINIGWLIGRPVIASIAMGVFSPLFAKYFFSPVFRWYVEHHFVRFKHVANVVLMVVVLCAFVSIADFAGASVLYGSFLAGTFLSSLPCTHPDAPFMALSREHGESDPEKTPSFVHTFEKYFLDAQQYVLQPMFFASIGFAIPFKKLWTGEAVWKGVVFSLLMLFGKAAVGFFIPTWDFFARRPRVSIPTLAKSTWKPATLLGMAMVARGEIGLLIIQIGLNETTFLSQEAFITAAWAIVLNTVIGPRPRRPAAQKARQGDMHRRALGAQGDLTRRGVGQRPLRPAQHALDQQAALAHRQPGGQPLAQQEREPRGRRRGGDGEAAERG